MAHRPEDLARTLTRRARARRIAAQKRMDNARAKVLAALRQRLRDGTEQRAWLIGSSVWGAPHGRSDIDVVVEGVASTHHALLWDELSEAAGMDIDLLHLEDLDPKFRARVLAEGTAVDER